MKIEHSQNYFYLMTSGEKENKPVILALELRRNEDELFYRETGSEYTSCISESSVGCMFVKDQQGRIIGCNSLDQKGQCKHTISIITPSKEK